MAAEVEKLFVEYARRRKRGQEAQKVVLDLRTQIRALPDLQKQTLKLRIRKWEEDYMPVPAGAFEAARVLSPQPAVHRVVMANTLPAQAEAEEEIVDVICHFCGRLNRPGEDLCRGCGRVVDPAQQYNLKTRVLRQTSELAYSDDFFGDDFMLSLTVRGTLEADRVNVYEAAPQDVARPMTIGRAAYGNHARPDIDLSEHDAEVRGVSRIHVAIAYDPVDHVLKVSDCDSANGTFINGQRLHREEIRVLRNGDELRLGKLVLSVKFYTTDFS